MEQTREYMLEIIQKEISDGKECMIGDVLDWVNKNIEKSFIEEKPVIYDGLDDYRQDILYKWHEARKPIDSQSDECIRYIYSLLPSEVRK